MPVAELIGRRYLPDVKDLGVRFDGLLRFFGVANRHAWNAIWGDPKTSFHRSLGIPVQARGDGSVASPPRAACRPRGDRRVRQERLQGGSGGDPRMGRSPIDRELIERMQERSARAGVALVIVPEIEGSRASGATRWLSADKAMIAMSLRYKADDRFWFTFFHEVAHVLIHGKRLIFIDDERGRKGADATGQEAEADRYSSDVLIPRQLVPRVRSLSGEADIRAFAEELALAPGIVVGRMQFLGALPWGTPLNVLRRPVDPDELAAAGEI